ncbi:olfactory receptor 10A3-like [Archocentrus centrarchus]|uniref:olfactory receptor 10A3-like n=1 Tax=Archocentrus centrarchus TaxID=63155 RepID=UPI0011E9E90E|nr:olfactory receptor 10A3-like [Archocentrus centrarchus]
MLNLTSPPLSYVILGAYINVGSLKYFYFTLSVIFYIIIIMANISLTMVICVNRSLHEPVYMFLCSLFVNELYGSTGLFPFLLIQILSDVHTVSGPLCFLQIFSLYTYANNEFCNLAVMSYDRYLAVCWPLQYKSIMTYNKVFFLVIFGWLYPFICILTGLSLTLRLTLCGNTIDSLYCRNYLIVKLACSDTNVNNIYGLFVTVVTILVPLLPILYSYLKILRICFSGSKQMRRKAVSTCTPHLASLLNFSLGCSFEILQSRFDMTSVPSVVRIFLSLYFLIIQPVFTPIMYGIQMSKIRKAYKHTFLRGIFKCCVEKGHKKAMYTFFVIKGDGFNILSYKTSTALGLINVVTAVAAKAQCRTVADELVESHPDLFQGIGKLKDFQVKLHINPDVKPSCQPHRRVPFHIREKVEDELKKLQEDDIIEDVTDPTPWVSRSSHRLNLKIPKK